MIAFIARSMKGHNGADLLAADILEGLCASREQVAVITDDARSTQASVRVSKVVRWVESPKTLSFPRRRQPRAYASWAKWSVLDIGLRRTLRELRPALTIVNAFGSHRESVVREVRDGGTTAIIVQESPRHFGGQHQPMPLTTAISVLASYSHLIFVSSQCRDEWLAVPAIGRTHAHYVPNCGREAEIARVCEQHRDAVRRRLGISPDAYAAVCVATLQHRKGQDILVDRFTELVEAVPNAELYFIGAPVHDRTWAASLRRRAAEHPSGAKMHFLGARDDAVAWIYAADVLLLPSRAEAMPLVVLEAMAAGTPAVAFAVDGVPEMIVHGHTGFLVDPAEPAQFIEAVRQLRGNPELRARIARHASDRYRRMFSRELLVKRYAALVDDVLHPTTDAQAFRVSGDDTCIRS